MCSKIIFLLQQRMKMMRCLHKIPVSARRSQSSPALIKIAETFFAERRVHGDIEKALAFLSRKGGDAPRKGDEG